MIDQSNDGFVFPGDPRSYPGYYILHSVNDVNDAKTILRETKAPYYHSREHPRYILVNVDTFPGDKMEEILKPAGLQRVEIGMPILWELALVLKDRLNMIELCPDEDEHEEILEASEVEGRFYDAWALGKHDEAIAIVEDSGIDVASMSFLFVPPCSITIYPGGLFVVSGSMDLAPRCIDIIITEIDRVRESTVVL